MPLNWDQLKLKDPKFDDRQIFLKTLGGYVVKDIIQNIEDEIRPDGTPQKQNTQEYSDMKYRRKGYRTPLWGVEGAAINLAWGQRRQKKGRVSLGKSSGIVSPYLANPNRRAWLVDFVPPDTAIIHLNKKREEIGIKVQEMGYWFMGLSDKVKKRIQKSARQYVKLKLRQMQNLGYD